ncbi:MAG TPA: thioredoxin domain-containing protein [Micropruina sp.]|nr:thioredoxin domain-containing protein [Micropruina sp.]
MANSSSRERLRAAQQAETKRRRARVIAAIGVGVGALVAIAVMIWASMGGAAPSATTRPPNATASNDGIVVNPGKAKPNAPVVGLYFDYQCSHCVSFEEKYGLTLNALSNNGDVSLVNHTRVFLDRGDATGLSHRAAIAAACADTAGVYKDYHQSIFSSAYQGAYTDDLFRVTIPQQLGLSGDTLTRFQSCYDDRSMAGFVQGVDDAAAKAGVNSTPTLMINGKTQNLTTLPEDVTKLKAFIEAAAKA